MLRKTINASSEPVVGRLGILEAQLRDLHGRIHRGEPIERNQHGESGSRKAMEGNDHWESRRWKTKSYRTR